MGRAAVWFDARSRRIGQAMRNVTVAWSRFAHAQRLRKSPLVTRYMQAMTVRKMSKGRMLRAVYS
jgi:hypothetical protein